MRELRLEHPDGSERRHSIELCVKIGDRLQPGDLIAHLEIDAAGQDLEAYEPGLIVGILKTPRGFILRLTDLPEDIH